MHAGLHHQLVDLRHALQRLGVHPADDLPDVLQAVLFVAGVDALGGVAHLEVRAALQPGLLLEDGHADLLGHAGIDRALEDHHRARLEVPAQDAAGALDGGEVGRVVVVDRRGHRHDVEARLAELRLVGGELHRRGLDGVVAHLVRGVHARPVQRDLRGVQVEAHDVDLPGEGHRDRHAHVAQAHQRELRLAFQQLLVQIFHDFTQLG